MRQINTGTNIYRYFIVLMMIMLLIVFLCTSCSCRKTPQQGTNLEQDQKIKISGDGISEPKTITLQQMKDIPGAQFEHIYSTINNWPSARKYAARGILVSKVLQDANISDGAKLITFVGDDGYEQSFTKEQLLETKRYYFPHVLEGDPLNAVEVEPLLAYEYMENSNSLEEIESDSICLIMPQADVNEQTNVVFVKNVQEIIVTTEKPGKWDLPTAFPAPGKVSENEKVKLQHKDMGLVKLFYTTDGTDPKTNGRLYNSSTYQPELNKPVPIGKDVIIKVFAKGFGKYDSDIATFEYKIK